MKKFVEMEAEEDDESEEFAEAPAEQKYTEEELAPRVPRLTSQFVDEMAEKYVKADEERMKEELKDD